MTYSQRELQCAGLGSGKDATISSLIDSIVYLCDVISKDLPVHWWFRTTKSIKFRFEICFQTTERKNAIDLELSTKYRLVTIEFFNCMYCSKLKTPCEKHL